MSPSPSMSAANTLAAELASRYPVVTMPAPPEGRRVGDEDDVRVLEALTAR